MKLILPFLLLIVNFGFAQNFKCSDVKTGNFLDPKDYDVKIIRTDSTQIEINLKNGAEVLEKVEWIDSCSYKLTHISNNEIWEKQYPNLPNDTIIVEIKQVTKEFYLIKSYFENKKGKPYFTKVIRE